MKARQKGKYNNRWTEVDGLKFQSQREAARWVLLRARQEKGEIRELERQVPLRLEVNGVLVARYYADFRYRLSTGEVITEDVKGQKTDVYRLKKKLVKACLGITILET